MVGIGNPKSRGADSDDLDIAVVQAQRFADDRRVAAELPHPEGVTEDGDRVASRRRLFGTEGASQVR